MASSIPMSLFGILAALCSFAYFMVSHRIRNKDFKLPPGPRGLPVLGNLLMLGDLPHRSLRKLAKKYGPIMYIKLGLVPTVVVSSSEAAKLFLKTHDSVFASRPKAQAAEYISYGRRGLAFTEYGSYWRNMRKFCTLELFTNTKIKLFRPIRREEVSSLVKAIKAAADGHEVVDLSDRLESLLEDMTHRMVFGSKDDGFEFKASLKKAIKLSAAFNLADFVPFMGLLDFQGLTRRLKATSKVLDGFLEKKIEEHIQEAKERSDDHDNHFKDFTDVMISLMEQNSAHELQLDRCNVKAIILDVLGGSTDTTITVLNWAFAELIRHPQVMKKVQQELNEVVGLERMVEETDLTMLDYLNMVVKETLRLYPAVPLLVPHESIEDITVNGFHVAKRTRVLINAWAIGRHPNVWNGNAQEFNPDRFINCDIDVQGHHFQLIPFGAGRRGCPGMQLGLTIVRLVLAQLIHCFNWDLPNGVSPSELDMREKFTVTMPRANHLFLVPTYRLKSENLS